MQEYTGAQWKWVQCPMVIQKTIKNQKNQQSLIFQSLKPVLCFQDQFYNQEQLNLGITLDKPIHYEQEQGFIWHKNCIIPQIKCTIQQDQFQKLKTQLQGKQVYCQITSVLTLRKAYYYLSNIPLQGQSNKSFGNNKTVKFNNLKFSETSFNKNKNKFSLLIWIYSLNKTGDRNTIKAFISSQIYVDSRKQARKKPSSKPNLSEKVQYDKFLEPIEIKVGNKKKKIENSIEGFMSFYGAANIRNKIKHPFYLAFHFNNVFSIYYNKFQCKNPFDALKKISLDKKFTSKILMIVTRADTSLRKKILLLFENWRFSFVTITLEADNLHSQQKWVQIPFEQVIQNYQKFINEQSFQPEILKGPPLENSSKDDKKRQNPINFEIHHEFCLQSGTRKKVKLNQDSYQ